MHARPKKTLCQAIERVSGKPLKVWWGLWNVLRLGHLDLHNFSLLIDFTLCPHFISLFKRVFSIQYSKPTWKLDNSKTSLRSVFWELWMFCVKSSPQRQLPHQKPSSYLTQPPPPQPAPKQPLHYQLQCLAVLEGNHQLCSWLIITSLSVSLSVNKPSLCCPYPVSPLYTPLPTSSFLRYGVRTGSWDSWDSRGSRDSSDRWGSWRYLNAYKDKKQWFKW